MENSSYFVASKHRLSTFFSLIFRSPTSYHPLLASAVSKLIMQDPGNRLLIGKDEKSVTQLIKMLNSDNRRSVCCLYVVLFSCDLSLLFRFIIFLWSG